MSPFLKKSTLAHGKFDKELIYPHHAWIPSPENLIQDELGYTLLDTGVSENKHHLLGYNGAGAPESRISLTVEGDAPGGGSVVPAIQYNYSRFFRGQEAFETIPPNSYMEVLFHAAGAYSWRHYWGTDSGSFANGFACCSNNPPKLTSFGQRSSSYRLLDNAYRLSERCSYLGLLFYYTSSVRAMISTYGLKSYSTGNRTSNYPFTIGGNSGGSGTGATNNGGVVGPILIFEYVAPSNRDKFLQRRMARIQNGNWQPFIVREDLRP